MDRADQLKKRLLEHPEVRAAMSNVLSTGRKLVLAAIEDPDSELRRRVSEGLASLGRRLQDDPALRTKVDGWIENAACFAVRNYRDEVSSLISETVARWDAAEAVPQDRAAGGPGPPVHPHQRHGCRRPGRPADPHRVGAPAVARLAGATR